MNFYSKRINHSERLQCKLPKNRDSRAYGIDLAELHTPQLKKAKHRGHRKRRYLYSFSDLEPSMSSEFGIDRSHPVAELPGDRQRCPTVLLRNGVWLCNDSVRQSIRFDVG